VFGGAARARTAEEVLGRWEEVKARERQAETSKNTPARSILGGVPRSLPALLRAYEMGTRAAAVGFDWERSADVLDKIDEEVAELREAVERREGIEEEMGDLLFALANLARKLGIEPEAALRSADDKFARRFTTMERRFAARGESLKDAGLARMEEEWGRIKEEE
ncbi:MAG: nucleoside triphosphate pyrophosphohydrolase, partial [Acidobacteria bacterium]|nr:nucleoside triphosphate pyrophosphohydrolase [Acidobacteriota bacterium]